MGNYPAAYGCNYLLINFYKIIGNDTSNAPYPLFVLPGILAWFNFTKIINESGAALVNNKDLIRKLEFPKMILLYK